MGALLIIVVLLFIGMVLWGRQINDDELRRLKEKHEREHQERLRRYEREQRELEEKCKGKTPEECVKLIDEAYQKSKAEYRKAKRKLRELERAERERELAEQRKYQSSLPIGTIRIVSGSALPITGWGSNEDSESTLRSSSKRSHDCGCDCEDCLDGRHEDCEDDCDHW